MKTATTRHGDKKKHGPASRKASAAYQLKVTLEGIAPPIWRRLEVPGDMDLEKLHEVIQVAMGWTNSHLHQFIVGETFYGIPDDDMDDPLEAKDERRYTLAQIAKKTSAKFVYQYDFGDNWEHLIVVEGIRVGKTPAPPKCLAGERRSPPEDVGSVPGYKDFLKAVRNPKHPEHKNLLEWVGGKFDPETFDVEIINQDLAGLRMAGSLESFWGADLDA
ncbi:MAG: plasmid pRiA4b ORF-3 family protein [Elusimicrobia bacterium]|nr:plasmid pRiA4b ORF-3 family protein [Elusimicrobiota bacterium]